MSPALMFIVVVVLFAVAYLTYGRLLARRFGMSAEAKTPAHQVDDGEDFVPTSRGYLLAQHFSAISAAGPIVGPIAAALAFGWLPALLWIVVGAIFIGAMHDFAALAGSVKHQACSIAEIIGKHMSKRAHTLFLAFVWLALVYVIVAFTDITARAFVADIDLGGGQVVLGGGTAVSSVLYLVVGVLMGVTMRVLRPPLWLSTAIFVPLVGVVIVFGQRIPLTLGALDLPLLGKVAPVLAWDYLILAYCGIASILPVWSLLQPRGYLGGFFLYGMIGAAVLGILFGGHKAEYPAFLGWTHERLGPLVPVLFVTIACGACSGFHGLVCSGTTSKQLDKETDAHLVGYGGMLLEGVVAVISLVCVMVLVKGSTAANEDPNLIFARGIGAFMEVLQVDKRFAVSFGMLAFGTFVFDTLDVATRLGRYILQEFFGKRGRTAAILATTATLLLPAFFMSSELTLGGKPVPAWKVFWSVFGTSNQLLAALTLLGLMVWLRAGGRRGAAWMAGVPMVFMMTMTLWSIYLMLAKWLAAKNWTDPVGWVAIVLGGLAVLLMAEAAAALRRSPAPSR